MTIIKDGCSECGKDWYTTTEQCDTYECQGHRKDFAKEEKAE